MSACVTVGNEQRNSARRPASCDSGGSSWEVPPAYGQQQQQYTVTNETQRRSRRSLEEDGTFADSARAVRAVEYNDSLHAGGRSVPGTNITSVSVERPGRSRPRSADNEVKKRIPPRDWSPSGSHRVLSGSAVATEKTTSGDALKFSTSSGIDVEVYQQDLLREKVGAIVNPANSLLSHGGGAARSIADAAGSQLQLECQQHIYRHKELKCTEVIHTTAGNLRPYIQYVIHTVGPQATNYGRKGQELFEDLAKTFYNCLRYANNKLNVKSVAIPGISSGEWKIIRFMHETGTNYAF